MCFLFPKCLSSSEVNEFFNQKVKVQSFICQTELNKDFKNRRQNWQAYFVLRTDEQNALKYSKKRGIRNFVPFAYSSTLITSVQDHDEKQVIMQETLAQVPDGTPPVTAPSSKTFSIASVGIPDSTKPRTGDHSCAVQQPADAATSHSIR
jgi:hypothetical protein